MKFLTVAVILAIVAFITAQTPPPAIQSCTTVTTNSTAIAFCSSVWVNGYAYLNGTDLSAANAAAQTQYNSNVARITNPSASCQQALVVFACQSSLPRCGRYNNFPLVAVARCNNVNQQCNVTGFPTATGFTGTNCVNNTIFTIDGPALNCVNPTYVALGASCTGNQFFDPATINPSPYVINACPIVSSCNTTAANPTCVRPNNLGDACTGTCTSPTGNVGSALACIAGTCQYSGKRFGYTCINNAECLSQNCTNGQCYESPVGGACLSTANCRLNLYCDTFNKTCYNAAQQGEFCSFVQPGQTLVPCLNGFTCTPSGNLSRCVANAATGAACSAPAAGSTVYANPLCAIGNTCVNGVCVAGLGYQQLGQGCNATTPCDLSLTCSYPANSQQGTCAQPGNVACDIVGTTCNTYQRCICGTDQSAQGTCGADTANPIGACQSSVAALALCLNTNCGGAAGAAFFPYDSYSCASKSCLSQQNAYFCCARNAAGANFVAPTGFDASACATTAAPTPTPGPTGNGTTTGAPRRSSRSGASAAVVSFVAMVIAVVAFCL